jgi:L-cysteate sulfo-lyase
MSNETPSITSHLPRVPIAHLPTPIEPLPRLSQLLGVGLHIKRDDQTGLATGGNKARKLEFLMAEALEAGADIVVTTGAIQSNHCRQTAAAAVRVGLGAHLVLSGSPPDLPSGNVLLDMLLGANLHWTDEPAPCARTLVQVAEGLRAAGRTPYVVPYGGSNPVGVCGYVLAMEEFAHQSKAVGGFDAHVFATSSGGTQAGMLLGARAAGVKDRLIGISVDATADVLCKHIADLADRTAEFLRSDERFSPDEIIVYDDYLGGGYAVVGEPEREAIRLLARSEGILADPVYTGRALAGLIDLCHKHIFQPDERVLFWHTGGTAALFAMADKVL